MAKFTVALSLLFAITLCGCGNNPGQTVHAAPPVVQAVPQSNPDCSTKWTQQVSDGFLALNLGPCDIFVADPNTFGGPHGLEYSYSLPRAIHVTSLYVWVGTYPQAMEVGGRLLIDTPAGLHREYEIEYDKHAPELSGEKTKDVRLDLTLPAGTTFTLQRTEGIVADCSRTLASGANTCGMEYRFVFQED